MTWRMSPPPLMEEGFSKTFRRVCCVLWKGEEHPPGHAAELLPAGFSPILGKTTDMFLRVSGPQTTGNIGYDQKMFLRATGEFGLPVETFRKTRPVETFPGNPKEVIIDPSKHSLFRGGMFPRVAEKVHCSCQRPVETFLPLRLQAFLPLRLQGFERHRPVETFPGSTRKRFYGPPVRAGDPSKHSITRSSTVETFFENPPKRFDGGPAKMCVTVETFSYETFRRVGRKN